MNVDERRGDVNTDKVVLQLCERVRFGRGTCTCSSGLMFRYVSKLLKREKERKNVPSSVFT
jgi:hypothetical protein